LLVVTLSLHFPTYSQDEPKNTTEAGFTVEQEFFGSINVIFEDEMDGNRPPFFETKYDKISHFFLQCEDGKVYRYRLGGFP